MTKEELAALLTDPAIMKSIKDLMGTDQTPVSWSLVVSLLSAAFAGLAAFFIYRQTKADHERSRRAYAVDLIFRWVASIQRESSGINKFVESLTVDNCASLWNGEQFSVPAAQRMRLTSLLRTEFGDSVDNELKIQDGRIELKAEYSYYIRYLAIKYLNNLEAVMTAWSYGVADEEIIVRQYQYLVDEKDSLNAMATFRQKVGKEHFPSINKFANHITRLRDYQQSQIGKNKVI